MADDIMPEEAVRRRQLGIQNRELDAKLRSMREASPGVMEEADARAAETQRRNAERVQAQRERQRAAQEKFQAEERARASRAPTAPSAGDRLREGVRPGAAPAGRSMMGRAPGLAGAVGTAIGLGQMAVDAYRGRGEPSAPAPRQSVEPGARAESRSSSNQMVFPEAAERRGDQMVFPEAGSQDRSQSVYPEATSRSRSAPSRPAARGSSESDKLNAIVLRLQRGEKPVTETEKRLADAMGIAYRKGGMVKPKGHNMREEGMEMRGGRYRGGMKEEMAEMMPARKKSPMPMMKKGGKVMKYQEGGAITMPGKTPKMGGSKSASNPKSGRMRDTISDSERRELDAPLTQEEKDRMRSSGFKKGGAIKAPAKKMKSGGKVAPKKMMKGGMTAKPKKMMGGGRAMYAKGGMTRGCK
jgi:hypothetical protein